MNIDKYLNNTSQSENGVFYKDEEAFKSHVGICYIGEYGLNDLEAYKEDGKDLTDEQIVEEGIGSTYESILAECEENKECLFEAFKENYEDIDLNHIAESVFDEADWAYISTLIDQYCNF